MKINGTEEVKVFGRNGHQIGTDMVSACSKVSEDVLKALEGLRVELTLPEQIAIAMLRAAEGQKVGSLLQSWLTHAIAERTGKTVVIRFNYCSLSLLFTVREVIIQGQ